MSNYLSTAVAVQAIETAYGIGTDIPTDQVSAIQNNTGAVVQLRFNGGTGVMVLPIDGFYEPPLNITGSIAMWGTGAGNICVLG